MTNDKPYSFWVLLAILLFAVVFLGSIASNVLLNKSVSNYKDSTAYWKGRYDSLYVQLAMIGYDTAEYFHGFADKPYSIIIKRPKGHAIWYFYQPVDTLISHSNVDTPAIHPVRHSRHRKDKEQIIWKYNPNDIDDFKSQTILHLPIDTTIINDMKGVLHNDTTKLYWYEDSKDTFYKRDKNRIIHINMQRFNHH